LIIVINVTILFNPFALLALTEIVIASVLSIFYM